MLLEGATAEGEGKECNWGWHKVVSGCLKCGGEGRGLGDLKRVYCSVMGAMPEL